jgi:hypothetical protein
VANKKMELVKYINEIDLAGLEGRRSSWFNSSTRLSKYLTTSNVLVVLMLLLILRKDENPFKDGNLLVPKRYVDQSIPNLSN